MADYRLSPDGSVAILTIDNRWAEEILSGEKAYEYRRGLPEREPPYTALLYAPLPVREIVGEVVVDRHITGPLREVLDQTVDDTPHDRGNVAEFFDGEDEASALHIDSYTEYSVAVSLDALKSRDPSFSPPESFQFIHPDEDRKLFKFLTERTPEAAGGGDNDQE